MGKFDFSHELFDYLGYHKEEDKVEQGYCKVAKLPLGLDEYEMPYYQSHAEQDRDADYGVNENENLSEQNPKLK